MKYSDQLKLQSSKTVANIDAVLMPLNEVKQLKNSIFARLCNFISVGTHNKKREDGGWSGTSEEHTKKATYT